MNFKNDLKSVVVELSPIFAGFKLAVIVIGYFGLGSVAKWFISYWYPFTRSIWDVLMTFLTLPILPVVVKDSLTALIFFLPLGFTAIWQKYYNNGSNVSSHRLLGATFGALFLIIICKDVLTSIYYWYISISEIMGPYATHIIKRRYEKLDFLMGYFVLGYISFVLIALMAIKIFKLEPWIRSLRDLLRKNFRKLVMGYALITLLSIFLLGSAFLLKSIQMDPSSSAPILSAIAILIVIVGILIIAILYAPRKLYVTTGAAIAFVFAAILFEVFLLLKNYIESVAGA